MRARVPAWAASASRSGEPEPHCVPLLLHRGGSRQCSGVPWPTVMSCQTVDTGKGPLEDRAPANRFAVHNRQEVRIVLKWSGASRHDPSGLLLRVLILIKVVLTRESFPSILHGASNSGCGALKG